MEMPEAASRSNHYDAMSEEINTRKSEIGDARDFAALQDDFGRTVRRPSVTSTLQDDFGRTVRRPSVTSKLQAYRAGSNAIKSYNRSTERLLASPTGGQQQRYQLIRPQAGMNGRGAAAQYPSEPPPSSEWDASHDAQGNPTPAGMIGSEGGLCSSPIDVGGESIVRLLTKKNRALSSKVQMLEEELEKYKRGLDSVHHAVDDISNESMNTDQDLANLADDLRTEQSNHKNARRGLEQKTVEVNEQAARLAELEEASSAAHRENLELSQKIHEMNRIAEQHQQEQEEAEAVAAAAAAAAAATAVGIAGSEGGGDEPGSEEMESLQKELKKLKAAMEFKVGELEAVNARAAKSARDLHQLRGQAKSGGLKRMLLNIWSLARAVGFMGFMLFAYLAVSEDAFRSRGVDVYRLAH